MDDTAPSTEMPTGPEFDRRVRQQLKDLFRWRRDVQRHVFSFGLEAREKRRSRHCPYGKDR